MVSRSTIFGFSLVPLLASTLLCTVFSAVMVFTGNDLLHLCVIPITICGIMIGYDLMRWAFGELDPFDPAAFASFIFFNGFYVAPLVQLSNNFFPLLPPIDWPTWFGVWGLFQVAGLSVYGFSRAWFTRKLTASRPAPREFLKGRFVVWTSLLSALSLAMYARVYLVLGGISGALGAYQERADVGGTQYNPFAGLGIEFTLITALAVILPLSILVLTRRKPWARSNAYFISFAIFSLLLAFVAAGLFGARSRMVYPMFIAIASYSFLVRPIAKRWLIVGAVGAIAFMNVYYWYKMDGLEGVSAIFDARKQQAILSKKYVDNAQLFTMTRDFSRADTQSLLLERAFTGGIPPALGRTYVAGAVAVVPHSLLPDRPDTVSQEITDAIYSSGHENSTLLVGLFGEALLNFGPVLAIFVYILPGFLVALGRKYATSLDKRDARRILVGPICLLPVIACYADSNVIGVFLVMYFAYPLILVWMASRAVKTMKMRVSPLRRGVAASR